MQSSKKHPKYITGVTYSSDRNRTCDLGLMNPALYQLSYAAGGAYSSNVDDFGKGRLNGMNCRWRPKIGVSAIAAWG